MSAAAPYVGLRNRSFVHVDAEPRTGFRVFFFSSVTLPELRLETRARRPFVRSHAYYTRGETDDRTGRNYCYRVM